MNIVLIIINTTGSVLVLSVVGWLILTRHVHEGVLIKLGLICIEAAAFGLAVIVCRAGLPVELVAVARVAAVWHIGVVVTLAGVVWRLLRRPEVAAAARQASGWVSLSEEGARRG